MYLGDALGNARMSSYKMAVTFVRCEKKNNSSIFTRFGKVFQYRS